MAIAYLLLAITKRVMVIADLLWCKTSKGGLITMYVAAPAVKDVFVAVLNAGITKRVACLTLADSAHSLVVFVLSGYD